MPQINSKFDEKRVSHYFFIFQDKNEMKEFGKNLRRSSKYIESLKNK